VKPAEAVAKKNTGRAAVTVLLGEDNISEGTISEGTISDEQAQRRRANK